MGGRGGSASAVAVGNAGIAASTPASFGAVSLLRAQPQIAKQDAKVKSMSENEKCRAVDRIAVDHTP